MGIPYIANHLQSFAVANLNCNSVENISGWTVVLCGQSLLHRLFHRKSFMATDQSMNTMKTFPPQTISIYGRTNKKIPETILGSFKSVMHISLVRFLHTIITAAKTMQWSDSYEHISPYRNILQVGI